MGEFIADEDDVSGFSVTILYLWLVISCIIDSINFWWWRWWFFFVGLFLIFIFTIVHILSTDKQIDKKEEVKKIEAKKTEKTKETKKPKEKNMNKDKDLADMFRNIFLDAVKKSETLTISNVLIDKGKELKNMYVIPGNSTPFLSEDDARREMKIGESIFRVNLLRIE